MAVEASRIKARLRALFPKANLSTKRLDEISAKLAKKPEDSATDAQIDEVLTDYNDNGSMSFEEIARNDDKIRTLEAGKKPEPKAEEPNEPIDPNEPAWFTKYKQEQKAQFEALEAKGTQKTLAEKFSTDRRLKGIPEFMFKGRTPLKEEDFETAVEDLINDYKPYAEKHKLSGFGEDAPPSGDSTDAADKAKGKVTPIDAETAAKIVGV